MQNMLKTDQTLFQPIAVSILLYAPI